VTRILFDSTNTKAIGVEVGQERDGERWVVASKREVVICLGAYGSPQLLLASGVGKPEELRKLAIPVVKELPVGEGLKVSRMLRDRGARLRCSVQDHVMTTVAWEVKKGTSLQYLLNPLATVCCSPTVRYHS
jgi:choline dehydrogenase